jgi:hypothetical protein
MNELRNHRASWLKIALAVLLPVVFFAQFFQMILFDITLEQYFQVLREEVQLRNIQIVGCVALAFWIVRYSLPAVKTANAFRMAQSLGSGVNSHALKSELKASLLTGEFFEVELSEGLTVRYYVRFLRT